MADGSPAIRAALKSVYPQINIGYCDFHFEKNLNAKFSKKYFPQNQIFPKDYLNVYDCFYNKSNDKGTFIKTIIRNHVNIMKILPNKDLFDQFFKICTPFWKHYCLDFFDFF